MSKKLPEPLLEIARITKAHGVRGEVVLYAMVDSDELLLGDVIVAKNATTAPQNILHITKTRRHHQTVLATFEGITDRTTAEGLRNQSIYIPRHELPAVEDEIYIYDMLGITIFVKHENEQYPLGTLENVASPAGQELWFITTPNDEEILFPAVPEFIVDIDINARTAIIAPPAGLLGLYLKKE